MYDATARERLVEIIMSAAGWKRGKKGAEIIVDAILEEWAAHEAERAVQRENEACYKIAKSFITEIGSKVDTRIIWTTNTAQNIASAIGARRQALSAKSTEKLERPHQEPHR